MLNFEALVSEMVAPSGDGGFVSELEYCLAANPAAKAEVAKQKAATAARAAARMGVDMSISSDGWVELAPRSEDSAVPRAFEVGQSKIAFRHAARAMYVLVSARSGAGMS